MAEARLSFQSHAEGFGFCEVVVYDNTIAAVSEGGAKLHFYDTSDPGTCEFRLELECWAREGRKVCCEWGGPAARLCLLFGGVVTVGF